MCSSDLGWEPSRVTKTACDFTRAELEKIGFTKQVLKKIAELYESIARLESNAGLTNPSAPSRAAQMRDIINIHF